MNALKTLLPIAAAVAALAAPVAANAALAVRISDGAGPAADLIVMDESGLDAAAGVGAVTYAGSFGGYTITIASGSNAGDPLLMHLTAGYSMVPSAVPAASRILTIEISATDLVTGVPGPVAFGGIGVGSGAATPGQTWSMFADDSNALFGTATALYSGASNTSGGMTAVMSGTYSATLRAVFDLTSLTGSSFASGSMDLDMGVPEPASIALVGLALLGIGAARRRKA